MHRTVITHCPLPVRPASRPRTVGLREICPLCTRMLAAERIVNTAESSTRDSQVAGEPRDRWNLERQQVSDRN